MLVTGSNFAGANHPAWSSNLLAHPEVWVSLHGRRIAVRAELVDDDEREAVWAYIERQWPGYRGYERASGRTLRIFRLVPDSRQS
jgi:deazaflavin-dependent oxidoreductase (nitroreductase family)